MTIKAFIAHGLVLVAALGAAPGDVQARIKCWTNKEGVRECGNVVPPEYAQQGHEELNKRGIVVDEQERAKTEEELEAQRRRAAKRAAEERARRQQEAADRVLLHTFSSVDDMKLARDGKIAAIESQIKLTENQIDKLENNLAEIIENAANQERRGKAPSESTQQDIEKVRSQIARKHEFIEEKRAEQQAVREEFAADIARFKELKGGSY